MLEKGRDDVFFLLSLKLTFVLLLCLLFAEAVGKNPTQTCFNMSVIHTKPHPIGKAECRNTPWAFHTWLSLTYTLISPETIQQAQVQTTLRNMEQNKNKRKSCRVYSYSSEAIYVISLDSIHIQYETHIYNKMVHFKMIVNILFFLLLDKKLLDFAVSPPKNVTRQQKKL